jgi:peptidoglycan/LPS O-acetylase OafA/YrhL
MFLMICAFNIKLVHPLNTLNEKYLSIDNSKSFRGILALAVLLHHLSQNIGEGILFQPFSRIGNLIVAGFFFLSGYGLQKSCISKSGYKKNFLLRRLPSVLLPYIIVTGIYWLMYAVGGSIYSFKDIVGAIINGKPIVLYSWYIISILVFYIVFWLLMVVFKENYKLMIFGGIIWIALYVIFCKMMDYGSWWYRASHLLIVGMIWAVYERKLLNVLNRFYKLIAPIVWLSFVLLVGLGDKIESYVCIDDIASLVSMLTAVAFVISTLLFMLKFKIGNKVLNYIGNISLEIYLTQGLFITIFHSRKMYIQNEFIFCVLVIIGCVVFASLLNFVLKKILSKYKVLIGRPNLMQND